MQFVNEVVRLGVVLHSTLSLGLQLNYVTKKVNYALFGLKFIRSCTTQALPKRLVESLVVPHLDYCAVVYFDASSTIRACLQRLENAGVRYTFEVRRNTLITSYRRQLDWLHNDSRRDLFALLLKYRIVRMEEPPFLLPPFKPLQSNTPTRDPRRNFDTKKYSRCVPGQICSSVEFSPAEYMRPVIPLAL